MGETKDYLFAQGVGLHVPLATTTMKDSGLLGTGVGVSHPHFYLKEDMIHNVPNKRVTFVL